MRLRVLEILKIKELLQKLLTNFPPPPHVCRERKCSVVTHHEPTQKVIIKGTMVKQENLTFYRHSSLYLSYSSYSTCSYCFKLSGRAATRNQFNISLP